MTPTIDFLHRYADDRRHWNPDIFDIGLCADLKKAILPYYFGNYSGQTEFVNAYYTKHYDKLIQMFDDSTQEIQSVDDVLIILSPSAEYKKKVVEILVQKWKNTENLFLLAYLLGNCDLPESTFDNKIEYYIQTFIDKVNEIHMVERYARMFRKSTLVSDEQNMRILEALVDAVNNGPDGLMLYDIIDYYFNESIPTEAEIDVLLTCSSSDGVYALRRVMEHMSERQIITLIDKYLDKFGDYNFTIEMLLFDIKESFPDNPLLKPKIDDISKQYGFI